MRSEGINLPLVIGVLGAVVNVVIAILIPKPFTIALAGVAVFALIVNVAAWMSY